MADYGLAISLPTHDVKTATLQQLAFSSKYPIFKLAFSGQLSLKVGPGSGSAYSNFNVSFTHGLGYIPAYHCYCSLDVATKRYMLDFNNFFNGTFTHAVPVYARMTTSTLSINADVFDNASKNIVIYYFIYADTGS